MSLLRPSRRELCYLIESVGSKACNTGFNGISTDLLGNYIKCFVMPAPESIKKAPDGRIITQRIKNGNGIIEITVIRANSSVLVGNWIQLVLLSSYPTEILDRYVRKFRWNRIEKELLVTVNQKSGKPKPKTELITANYPLPSGI
ncbi:hypothetical protein [Chitinophaga polysaccharea]|uniref:hypothetical protein n=1 Tax=Chitinophaga polysaccharea TaxID=1293035 RepID=UPI00115B23C6|nr:hypothetical protein [Chitinophaga polysaccharea]